MGGEESGNKEYTANWEIVTYNISYDYDGGHAPATANPKEYTVTDSVTISQTPTKDGYTFTGWTGDGITEPQETIEWAAGAKTGDKAYKANWEAVTYVITYDYAGGTAPATPNPGTYTAAQEISIANEPTKEGSVFVGWTSYDMHPALTDPTTPVKWSAGAEIGNKKFTANWAKKVKLTYNKNSNYDDATLTPSAPEVIAGAGSKVTLATAAYDGHHFVGWNTDEYGKGTSYDGGTEFTMPSTDITLWAQWTTEMVNVTYMYNYDGAPASGTFKTETVPEDNTHYQITGDVPTREEYLFAGWSTQQGAALPSQINYLPGQYMRTEEADITLYAVWVMQENEQRTYTHTLVGIGKTVYYTGERQEVTGKRVYSSDTKVYPADDHDVYIGVTSSDNPRTSSGEPYKYGGYVRIGQKTDGDPDYHNLYAYVEVTANTKLEGTDAGFYNGAMTAPVYAHRDNTGLEGMEVLYTTDKAGNTAPEFVPVTDSQLIIKPVPIDITTYSASKTHDGTELTAGGKAVIGADDDDQIRPVTVSLDPGENTITLRNGEKLKVEITGSQTDVGSSTNEVVVHWEGNDTTARQHNYTVAKHLGTLAVDDFIVRYEPGTTDHVANMPDNWEGDPDPGNKYTLPSNVPTREHSTFEGWKKNGEGNIINPSDPYTFPDNEHEVTFVAQWSAEVDTVTFDPNGGVYEGQTRPTKIPVTYNDNINIAGPASREHYTFLNWNTKQDGTGDPYQPNATYTVKGDVTFWANYKAIEYRITYNYAGGTEPATSNPKKYTVEDDVRITNPPTRTGYTFKGWTGDGYTDETTIAWLPGEKSGNKTFTAGWEANDQTVTYDPNGGTYEGSADPVKKDAKYDQTILVAGGTDPVREHFEFKGWKLGDTTYNSGASYTVKGDVTFVAQWEQITCEITFDPAGGTFEGKTVPVVHTENEGAKITLPAAPDKLPDREHYNFRGWHEEDGDNYQPGDEYEVTKSTTFVAQWDLYDTITFDPNGGAYDGKSEPTEIEVKDGDKIEVPSPEKRTGYTFKGWKANVGGVEKIYQPGEEIKISEDLVLTALWEEYPTLTYDPAGGTFRSSTKPTVISYEPGKPVTVAEAPTRDGYIFKGWLAKYDGKEVVLQPGDIREFPEDVVFSAIWESEPDPGPVPKVKIYFTKAGDGNVWEKGSSSSSRFVFASNIDDNESFGCFLGIQIDGADVPAKSASGTVNYTYAEGSVIVNLQPAYLETLSVGQHTIKALFNDGDTSARFTIKAKSSPNVAPKTGDENRVWLSLLTLLASGMLLVMLVQRRRRA